MEEANANNVYNAHISEPEEIESGIVIRMLLEARSPGRMQVVLVIDEYTKIESIIKNWKSLKFLLDQINKSQGNKLDSQQDSTIFGLAKLHQEGMSWGMMAMILNYLAIALTYCAFDESKNEEKSKKKIEKTNDNISDPSFVSGFGTMLLMTFFALGKTLEDFNSWMEQGYELLIKDRWEFGITDAPFDKGRVRDRVRYFEDSIKLGKITVPEKDTEWNSLEYLIYAIHLQGYFTKSNELLDKRNGEDWKRHRHSLQGWVKKIIDKWDDSQNSKIKKHREIIK